MRHRARRVAGIVGVLVVGTLTLAGCVSTGDTRDVGTTPTTDLAGLLPADVRAAGVLAVASDIEYAPVEFLDADKRPQGLDYDLAAALAAALGLRLRFESTRWDDLVPTLTQHKNDVIMSGMTDTAARQRNLTFVDYFLAGSQIAVPSGNPRGIAAVATLCGHGVAVIPGSTQADIAAAQSAKCTTAGKPPVRLVQVGMGQGGEAAVRAGRAEAFMDDYPVVAYAVKRSSGFLALAGPQVEAAPYGIGMLPDRTQLRTAIQAALERLIADGTYTTILAKWGLTAGSLKTAAIDGGA